MSLTLQWRQPEPKLTLTWAGLSAAQAAAVVLNPNAPLATLIGPPGPRGADGSEGSPYVHTQSSPATEWIVNHNRGFKPLASVLSAGGIEVVAEIVHMSDNQLRVYFNQPQAGSVVVR